MADFTKEELEAKVLEFLGTVDKAKNRQIADAIGVKKRDIDAVVADLANAGKIEYLYLGTSYVTLPENVKNS
ncbi:MAG: hypothetical protein U0N74_03560 [Peptococcaceae bacterium]|jgi:DNA-binding MarR family transcriptional regulator|nr:hypothetical protein [Peptococcaceae bacterium]